MNFFTTNPTIAFSFDNAANRARKSVRVPGGDPVEMLIYNSTEAVSGTVEVATPQGKKIEHQGIKIELIGQIELINDRLATPTKISTIVKLLDNAGTLASSKSFPFEFSAEKPFETYSGLNVRLRYFLKVTVTRKYNNYCREQDISVEVPQDSDAPAGAASMSHLVNNAALSNPIKMEVGIEECLHIEFEYGK